MLEMARHFGEEGVFGLFVSRARDRVTRLHYAAPRGTPEWGRAAAADLGPLVAIVPRRNDALGVHVVEDTFDLFSAGGLAEGLWVVGVGEGHL